MSMVTAFEQISNSLDIQLSLGVEEQRRVALKLLEGMHAAPAGLGLALRLGKLRLGRDVIVREILEARNPPERASGNEAHARIGVHERFCQEGRHPSGSRRLHCWGPAHVPGQDRAEKISPGSAKVHLIRGFAYSEMGHKNDSIQSYKKALRFGGDTTLIYGQLAQLYRELDEYPQAIAMVRNGLEKDASSPELLSILGEFLIERGEREKAERHLRKALFEDPASLPALLNLARALWEQGRESEAMDYFEEVRRLAPLNFRSRAFLAQYYLGKGEPERAETPLREAMDLEPENAELRQMLQVCLLESGNRKAEEGDYAGAVAYYKEALAGNPGAVELYRNLGVAYAEMEDYESAAESLKSYTEERPEDVNAWLMLGDIAWEEGEHARARDYWRKVIIVARRLNNSDRIIEAAEGRLRRMEPE